MECATLGQHRHYTCMGGMDPGTGANSARLSPWLLLLLHPSVIDNENVRTLMHAWLGKKSLRVVFTPKHDRSKLVSGFSSTAFLGEILNRSISPWVASSRDLRGVRKSRKRLLFIGRAGATEKENACLLLRVDKQFFKIANKLIKQPPPSPDRLC